MCVGSKTEIIYPSEEENNGLQQAYRQSNDKRYARRCNIVIIKSPHHGLTDLSIADLRGIKVETEKVLEEEVLKRWPGCDKYSTSGREIPHVPYYLVGKARF